MPHQNLVPHPKAPATVTDDFALAIIETSPGCRFCNGLTRVGVFAPNRSLIGCLRSEWPWNLGVGDDPNEHPEFPHYDVEWLMEDPSGNPLPGVATDLYFSAARMHSDWHRSQSSDATA